MEDRQLRKAAMFERVIVLAKSDSIADKRPLFLKSLAELQECAATVQQHQQHQRIIASERPLKDDIERRCDRLRWHFIKPVVDTCKPLLRFAPVEAMLHTPHKHDSMIKIATHGQRLADALAKPKYLDLLRDAGYSKEFMAEFRAEAAELAALAKRRRRVAGQSRTATDALQRAFSRGMGRIDVMEGMLRHRFEKEPSLEALWTATRRIGNRLGRPKASSNKPPSPTDDPLQP